MTPGNAIAMYSGKAMKIHLVVLSAWIEWHFSSMSIRMTLIMGMCELVYGRWVLKLTCDVGLVSVHKDMMTELNMKHSW